MRHGVVRAVLGTRLPGPGSIDLSHELRFLKAVRSQVSAMMSGAAS